jgi:aryl-alcohol dehydrogenase-like predicted oxidoreductase
MNYRSLGATGIKISEIGFGCMSLSSNSEKESIDLLHHAFENGINYFDTADLYDKGNNEIIVGKALKSIRNKVILATKVGNQWRSDGSGWDWNPSKAYILSTAEQSLKRLQTDHIDLYQLHGGTIDDPIDETIEAFEQLKNEGKILHYGISSIRPNVIAEYVKRSSIVSVMLQYSLIDRRPEEHILDLLQQNSISVLVRGALAQGILVNKPAKEYLGYTTEQVKAATKAIQAIDGVSGGPAAIGYVLNHPAVSAAVIGIRTTEQLREALASTALKKEQIQQLQQVNQPNKYEQHRIDHPAN